LPEGGLTVTIYGLSREGYTIAANLANKGYTALLVDENLHLAMEIKPAVARQFATVAELVGEEALLGVAPADKAVAGASYIFFAPKIRGVEEEGRERALEAVKEAAKYLERGATFIYILPLGLGDGEELADTLERVSGLRIGEELQLLYLPLDLEEAKQAALGLFDGSLTKEARQVIEDAGIKAPQPTSIGVAEVLYAKHVISRLAQLGVEIESQLRVRGEARVKGGQLREIYLDDVVYKLLDLAIISATLKSGDPFLYLATGAVKSVQAYIKQLVEEVRQVPKRRGFKASKTTIYLLWPMDIYEMRGSRQEALQGLATRLRDYVAEVQPVQSVNEWSLTFPGDRFNLLVACSKEAVAPARAQLAEQKALADVALFKANLALEGPETV
jgi:hypothetical protein